MPCKNDGCNGNTRQDQHFCYACYQAWHAGGSEAVQTRIDALPKPADLSSELLKRLNSANATIEALKSDVVQLRRSSSRTEQELRVTQFRCIESVRGYHEAVRRLDLMRGTRCQCAEQIRQPATKHPTAQEVMAMPYGKKLDRIESLVKQGLPRSMFWPTLNGILCGALGAAVYFTW